MVKIQLDVEIHQYIFEKHEMLHSGQLDMAIKHGLHLSS